MHLDNCVDRRKCVDIGCVDGSMDGGEHSPIHTPLYMSMMATEVGSTGMLTYISYHQTYRKSKKDYINCLDRVTEIIK